VLSWSIHYACRSGGTTPAGQNPSADRPGLRGLPSTASPVRVPFVHQEQHQCIINVLSWSIHCCNGVCTAGGTTLAVQNPSADRPGLRGSRQLAAPALTDGSTISLNGGRLLADPSRSQGV
jgi:hypothetical protein